jgi:hypothetical protein
MRLYDIALAVGLLAATISFSAFAKSTLSNSEIARLLIAESRASYSGNCPCPYDTDKRGHNCGKRSAYSRPGGEEPLCYEKDASPDMIEAYRREHSGK